MLASSPIPLYYQVANVLRHRILDGGYHPGERIGTEGEMCEEFGVSRITIRQALSDLQRQGLVTRRRKLGTFVADKLPQTSSVAFTGYMEDLLAQAFYLESAELKLGRVQADREVAEALALEVGEPVTRVERVRSLGGSRLGCSVSHLPLSIGAGITEQDLLELPLLHVLERRLGIQLDEAVQTIRAVAASAEIARKLEIPEGTPLLLIQRITYSEGRPVDYVLVHHRAERYQYTVRLGRISRGER